MNFVVTPPTPVSVPILGSADRFPVGRIYCVGRNYVAHAQEMGFTGREPPFFFIKPSDNCVPVAKGTTGTLLYPSLTNDYQHEIELVACIGTGGKNIKAADALKHIWGYAVGLDMTRRDRQGEQKSSAAPGVWAKPLTNHAPVAPLPLRLRWATLKTPTFGCKSTGKTASAATSTNSFGTSAKP